MPDKRRAAGKDERHDFLHAYHKGGNVIVECRTTARPEPHRILAKARERAGRPDEELSEDKINNLIFARILHGELSATSRRGVV